MELIRPQERPSPRVRGTVAVLLSLLTLLLVVMMVLAGFVSDASADAFRYFYTGILTMACGAGSWRAWRWTHEGRSLAPPPETGPPPRHRGLSGEDGPPDRW